MRRIKLKEYAKTLRKRGVSDSERLLGIKPMKKDDKAPNDVVQMRRRKTILFFSRRKSIELQVNHGGTLSTQQRRKYVSEHQLSAHQRKGCNIFALSPAQEALQVNTQFVLARENLIHLVGGRHGTLLLTPKGLFEIGSTEVIRTGESQAPSIDVMPYLQQTKLDPKSFHDTGCQFDFIQSYGRSGLSQLAFRQDSMFLIARGKLYAWGQRSVTIHSQMYRITIDCLTCSLCRCSM